MARASAILTAVTWVLLVVGAAVRVKDAGLACPDWPLCFGQIVPKLDVSVAFEFGHRVLAGIVGLAFLGLARAVYVERRRLPGWLPRLTLLTAIVLAVQIVLGGLTVLELLAEWTVASHLVTGTTFFCLLAVHSLVLRDAAAPRVRPSQSNVMRLAAVGLLALVPFQLALGGWIAGASAGLVCPTWPSCAGGAWFPTFSGTLGVMVAHRALAWGLFGAALAMAWRASGSMALPARALAVAVIVQMAIGVANVFLLLRAEITLLHTFGGAGVALCATWLAYEAAMAGPDDR